MAPHIGQAATLNGKPVRWSGENYGWQSPATHKKLEAQGKFKLGTQALDRLGNAINNSPITQRLKGLQQDFRAATDKLGFDKVENVVNRAVQADDKLPASRVAQGGAIAAQSITNRLGIDPRLALVGMVATGAGGGAIRKGANPRKATGVEPVSRVPQPTPPTGTTTSLGRPRNTQPATGQMRPGVSRVAQVNPDGTGLAWLPAQAKGVPAVTLPNGTRVRLDQSPGKAWSLEPFTSTRRPDGSIELDYPKANQPKKVEPVVPDPKEVLKPNPELLNRGSLNNPRPRSQAQFNEPQGTRPQRVHVEGNGGVRRLETGYSVNTSDMSKPRGDGNSYGNFEQVAALPDGWQETGNFITKNDQAYRQNRDQSRQRFLDSKTDEKGAAHAFQAADILDEAAWADGDITKLNAILKRLGATEQRYASDANRAIQNRVRALGNTYGQKAHLTGPETKQFTADWDWRNLNGVDLPEAKRLSALATERFGSANAVGNKADGPLRRPITPQPSGAYTGAQPSDVAEQRITERLATSDSRRPDRARAQSRPTQNLDQQGRPIITPDRSRTESNTAEADAAAVEYNSNPDNAKQSRRELKDEASIILELDRNGVPYTPTKRDVQRAQSRINNRLKRERRLNQ